MQPNTGGAIKYIAASSRRCLKTPKTASRFAGINAKREAVYQNKECIYPPRHGWSERLLQSQGFIITINRFLALANFF